MTGVQTCALPISPAYVDNTGALVTSSAQTVDDVFGIIFDRDCMGMTTLDQRVISTPVNANGLYRNIWVHMRNRVVFDNTEKCVILLLD